MAELGTHADDCLCLLGNPHDAVHEWPNAPMRVNITRSSMAIGIASSRITGKDF